MGLFKEVCGVQPRLGFCVAQNGITGAMLRAGVQGCPTESKRGTIKAMTSSPMEAPRVLSTGASRG